MRAANSTQAARQDRDARDQVLLRLIARGERPAFEELYTDYYRRLTRFLSRVTQRSDLIEEVINDSLWIVWRKAGEFHGDSRVSTWIMGIAYRCALKALRRHGGSDMLPLHEDDHPLEEPQAAQELRDWIGQGLRHLPAEQRLSLQLAYYHGHSLEEIAEIMDCPTSTVKARMFHARVRLRNLMPALAGIDKGELS